MKKTLILVRLDKDYCNYLREFDPKVPYNYNKKELRPFVGVLFQVNDYKYFAPLSSPKPKHLKLNNNIDFLKIDGGRLGAINFNNMVPVTDNNIIKINFDKKYTDKEEEKYLKLLKNQLYWLNRYADRIYKSSKKIYDKYLNGSLPKNVCDRCCDFKLLEEKCKEYNNVTV